MMQSAKMARHEQPDEIRFTFELGENVTKDVVFLRREVQSCDARAFRRLRFEDASEMYDIRTNDGGYSEQALWVPSEGTLSVTTSGSAPGEPREYRGSSLDVLVAQAYDDGAFE
jgi:hypothetical protein